VNCVKGLVTGCVPFAFVENEFIQRAMRSVGVQPPSRKQLGGSYLDRIFEADAENSLSMLAETEFICASSDGWRKRYCASGAALMNYTLLPGSGALIQLTRRNDTAKSPRNTADN
jgi:hypothetical protein